MNKRGWNGETGYVTHNEQLRQECLKNKDLCGGHSIVITGYNLKKRTFSFKNSWGKDGGQNGYGTMPFAYVNQYMQGNPTAAYLTQKVDLPIDHNTTLPRPSFNNLRYSLNPNDNENRFLTSIYLEIFLIRPTILFLFQQCSLTGTMVKKVTRTSYQFQLSTKKDGVSF